MTKAAIQTISYRQRPVIRLNSCLTVEILFHVFGSMGHQATLRLVWRRFLPFNILRGNKTNGRGRRWCIYWAFAKCRNLDGELFELDI